LRAFCWASARLEGTYELRADFGTGAAACCCCCSGSGEAEERSELDEDEAELLEAEEEGAGEASLTALLDFLPIAVGRYNSDEVMLREGDVKEPSPLLLSLRLLASDRSPKAEMASTTALSSAQETRLIHYLDDELSKLQRAFEARHSPSSSLPTLSPFLDQVLALLSFILKIPCSAPSDSLLRTAYYLTLTGLLPDALTGYELPLDTLPDLWRALRRFDAGWVAVLHGQAWYSTTESAAAFPPGITPILLSWTERARLSSLVTEIRSTLGIALGIPVHGGEGRKEYNPRGEVVEPRLKPLETEMSNGEEGKHESGALVDGGEVGGTPSLVEDGEDDEMEIMGIDTSAGDDDEDDDDDDFEEVDVSPSASPSSTSRALSPLSPGSQQSQEAFSIHFHAPPSAAVSADVVQALITEPKAAMDPDEEYGEFDGDENEEDRGVKIECEKVFEGTIAALKEMGVVG
jgi:hypothetical protein